MTSLRSAPQLPGYDNVELKGTERGARVYRAHETLADRSVLAKVYRRHEMSSFTSYRFMLEVDALRALSRHPNIATVLGSGVTETGQPFVVTEPVAGGSMSDRLNRSKLDPRTAVRAGLALCDALTAAHQAQILHGAIDPDSVVFGPDGQVQLSDFTCFSLGAPPDLSAQGWQNMEYAAPEVRRGELMRPASDTYSLAATLITMITGSWLFSPGAREDPSALLARLLSEATATESPQLTKTLRRALDDDPTKRYTTAADLRAALALAPEAQVTAPAGAEASTAAASYSGRRRRGAKPVARRPVIPEPVTAEPGVAESFVPTAATAVTAAALTEKVDPTTRRASKSRRRRPILIGLVAAAVLGLGAGGVAVARASSGGGANNAPPAPLTVEPVVASPLPAILTALPSPTVSASCQGLTCVYTVNQTGKSSGVSADWTLANGHSVSGATTRVSYPQPGKYTVSVMTQRGQRRSEPVRSVVTLTSWQRSVHLLTNGSTNKHLTIAVAAGHQQCQASIARTQRYVNGHWGDSHRWRIGSSGRRTVAVDSAGVYRAVVQQSAVANGRCGRAASSSATIHEPVVTPPPADTSTTDNSTTNTSTTQTTTSTTPPSKPTPIVAPSAGFGPPP